MSLSSMNKKKILRQVSGERQVSYRYDYKKLCMQRGTPVYLDEESLDGKMTSESKTNEADLQ